jgi:hypothetical protein
MNIESETHKKLWQHRLDTESESLSEAVQKLLDYYHETNQSKPNQ